MNSFSPRRAFRRQNVVGTRAPRLTRPSVCLSVCLSVSRHHVVARRLEQLELERREEEEQLAYEERRRKQLAAAEARQKENEQKGLNPRAAAKLKASKTDTSTSSSAYESRRNDELVAGWRS